MTALITRDELHKLIDRDDVTVVDALGGTYYEQQHLPGAIPLKPADVTTQAAELLPDTEAAIVTYCANEACPNSEQVASKLERLGYTNVRKYREGIQDWLEAGLPIHTGAPVGA
ncbi:MAG: rhodanese-like domain-containing protein [Corynebacteriales bacterium]|nr:rhodanese-like domain-containing protein [Mycobacteriales bacterium]